MNIKEPLLMPFQNLPFNGDGNIVDNFLMLKNKFNISVAIETGTCLGYTTKWLSDNFKRVKTVEVSPLYYDIAKTNRLSGKSNIMMVLGKSEEKLKSMLIDTGDDTIIFLDAHWGNHCPLQQELDIIAEIGIRPCIVIHDFLVPDHQEFGYDSYKGQPFTYDWLKDKFVKIYGANGYEYFYNDKADGAMRGVIYLMPKK